MQGLGAAMLAQAAAIQSDVEGVSQDVKATLAQRLTRQFAVARPSLGNVAERIAAAVVNGQVESLNWQHALKDWSSSGSYISFEGANQVFPWEGGTNTNQAPAGQYDLIQWVGFAINHDVQAATLAQLFENGAVEITWGDVKEATRQVPLQEFIFSRIHKFGAQGALASGAAPLFTFDSPLKIGNGFYFDQHKPLIVQPGDTKPKLKIVGLSGTIAGSSPALKVQYGFKGVRVRV